MARSRVRPENDQFLNVAPKPLKKGGGRDLYKKLFIKIPPHLPFSKLWHAHIFSFKNNRMVIISLFTTKIKRVIYVSIV